MESIYIRYKGAIVVTLEKINITSRTHAQVSLWLGVLIAFTWWSSVCFSRIYLGVHSILVRITKLFSGVGQHRLSASDITSLGLCANRKGGTGEGGWVGVVYSMDDTGCWISHS